MDVNLPTIKLWLSKREKESINVIEDPKVYKKVKKKNALTVQKLKKKKKKLIDKTNKLFFSEQFYVCTIIKK